MNEKQKDSIFSIIPLVSIIIIWSYWFLSNSSIYFIIFPIMITIIGSLAFLRSLPITLEIICGNPVFDNEFMRLDDQDNECFYYHKKCWIDSKNNKLQDTIEQLGINYAFEDLDELEEQLKEYRQLCIMKAKNEMKCNRLHRYCHTCKSENLKFIDIRKTVFNCLDCGAQNTI